MSTAIDVKKSVKSLKRFLDMSIPPMPDKLVEKVVGGFKSYWSGEIDWLDIKELGKRTSLSPDTLKALTPFLAIRIQAKADVKIFAEIDGWNRQGEKIFPVEEDDDSLECEAYYNDLIDDAFRHYLNGKIKSFKVVIVGEAYLVDALDPSKKVTQPDSIIGEFERPSNSTGNVSIKLKAQGQPNLAGYC